MLTHPKSRSRTSRHPRRAPARFRSGTPGPVRREFGRELIAEIDGLCRPPRISGVLFLASDFAAIVIAAAISSVLDNPFITVLAVTYIGIRQRYISNLLHECVHLKLVRSKTCNKLLGHMGAILLIQSFTDYLDEHREHHALLGREGDPKLASYAAKGATTLRQDKWEFVLHVVVANAVWALPAQTIRSWFTRRPHEALGIFVTRTAFWALVLGLVVWTRAEWLVLCYWVIPLTLVRPTVNWLTDLGNHAGLLENRDPILQTRGWTSHFLMRHALGGHLDDMYHPIHHLCPKVPFRQLPTVTQMIRERYPRAAEICWCSGFFFRRRRSPAVPCVIEDIVIRLRYR